MMRESRRANFCVAQSVGLARRRAAKRRSCANRRIFGRPRRFLIARPATCLITRCRRGRSSWPQAFTPTIGEGRPGAGVVRRPGLRVRGENRLYRRRAAGSSAGRNPGEGSAEPGHASDRVLSGRRRLPAVHGSDSIGQGSAYSSAARQGARQRRVRARILGAGRAQRTALEHGRRLGRDLHRQAAGRKRLARRRMV